MPKRDMVKEVSIAGASLRLRINKSDLDGEVEKQPEFYFSCAEQAGIAHSERVGAKDELERLEARLYRLIATKMEKDGERVTENAVRGRIMNHPKRIKAFEFLQQKLVAEKTWEALKDAAQQRSYALKDLCNLTTAGYLAQTSMAGGPSPRIKEAAADANRAEMAKKRKKLKV